MLIHLNEVRKWENLIEESKEKPIIIFKNSNACAVSSVIRNIIQKAIDDGQLFTPVYMVTVQEHRSISNQIAEDMGVKHETPQVIIIRSGHPVYHNSHYAITIQDITDTIERNA